MSSDDRTAFLRAVLSEHGYNLMERIGSGSYGCVYAVLSQKYADVVFAAKIMTLDSHTTTASVFETEIEILTRLWHPNIVSLFDAFHSENVCFLILEHCTNGTIDSYIEVQKVAESQIVGMFRPIISAVAYCHSEGIALRDVKPANILIDHYGRPKLVDFGLSCIVKAREGSGYAGSLAYMAPEVFRNPEHINLFAADIWSLGITFYTLLVGCTPWRRAANPGELVMEILTRAPELTDVIDPTLRGIIARMTAHDPAARPSAAELMQEPVFQEQQRKLIVRPAQTTQRRLSETQCSGRIAQSHSVAPHGTARPPQLVLQSKAPGTFALKPPTHIAGDHLRRFSHIATPRPGPWKG
jgi:serine/threonine protein kinase